MMRVLVAADSFKGSLSSAEAGRIIADAFRDAIAGVAIDVLRMADGGEGTVDALRHAIGGRRRSVVVAGPYGEPVEAEYAVLSNGSAVIEMAAAAGMTLAGAGLRVAETTTHGVGELIARAAALGAGRILVGIGGSATNDGGCGTAAACGVRFFDRAGSAFVPTGGTLAEVVAVDASGLTEAVRDCTLVAMCDVDNPLVGPAGAAHVFGPQKGADPAMVARLDDGLAHLASVTRRGPEIASRPGAGAGGGLGFGLAAFLGAGLRPGIDVVLEAIDFDARLTGIDVVITGEGRLDAGSARGKAVSGIARCAAARGVSVHVLAGQVEPGAARAIPGVVSARATTPDGQDIVAALTNAEENLARAARQLAAELAT